LEGRRNHWQPVDIIEDQREASEKTPTKTFTKYGERKRDVAWMDEKREASAGWNQRIPGAEKGREEGEPLKGAMNRFKP